MDIERKKTPSDKDLSSESDIEKYRSLKTPDEIAKKIGSHHKTKPSLNQETNFNISA